MEFRRKVGEYKNKVNGNRLMESRRWKVCLDACFFLGLRV